MYDSEFVVMLFVQFLWDLFFIFLGGTKFDVAEPSRLTPLKFSSYKSEQAPEELYTIALQL